MPGSGAGLSGGGRDSGLGQGVDAVVPALWQEAAAASAACSLSDSREIPNRDDHGRPGEGMRASRPLMDAPPGPVPSRGAAALRRVRRPGVPS
jgi:hypothetical protein